MSVKPLTFLGKSKWVLAIGTSMTLGACGENNPFSGLTGSGGSQQSPAAAAPRSPTLLEQDVESPEDFQVTEAGLWDGRPSLGGIWIAHPDVDQPERVIIRNLDNGKSIVGALFRRERDNPGPTLQVSSDAADALGMLAGAPAELQVTALRREEVEVAPPPIADPELTDPVALPEDLNAAPTQELETPSEIEATPLSATPEAPAAAPVEAPAQAAAAVPGDPIAGLEAVIAAAESNADAPSAGSGLAQPFIQVATFTQEENANRAAEQLSSSGLNASVRAQGRNGAAWRALVGPAATESERAELLRRVQALGFNDAFVTGA